MCTTDAMYYLVSDAIYKICKLPPQISVFEECKICRSKHMIKGGMHVYLWDIKHF